MEAYKVVSTSLEKFCAQFFKIYTNSVNDNVICSPLSVDIVLAMLSFGASGNTLKQIHNALEITAEETFKKGYQALIDAVNNVQNVELSVANKLFVSTKIPVLPEYLQLSEKVFKSEIENVDFNDVVATSKSINSWCEKQTKKRIAKIVSPGDLNSEISLVLVNAIYFKGQWQNKFDPADTKEMPFYVDKKNFKNVSTMRKTAVYNHGFIDELMSSFIEIPYLGGELSMVIILPMEFEGLKHVKENIDNINITEILKTGSRSEVELHLPKFKVETEIDLDGILTEMGMKDMFTTSANFSNMSMFPICVDKAIQKAFILVNEEGSEAAAVTSIGCRMACYPKCFSVNHPFTFQIIKTVSDKDDVRIVTPLFNGIIQEPKFDD